MATILVAEDEKNIQTLYSRLLKQANYHSLTANNGVEALAIIEDQQVDLLILDIMMPEMNGFEVVEMVRRWDPDLPIMMVTAKEAVTDKKRGFLAGADDYLVKPVDETEFILRVQALLRRSKIYSEKRLTINQTILNSESFTIDNGKDSWELPKKEFMLLFKLLSYPNKIFTRQQLMEEFWERDSDSDERTIDTHIKKLRKKFADNPDFDILTVRGLGYKAVKK
ncbi:response regulator transcription factor [uncultured Vagococcus sp.]|uniref:response regulator transcription factor n=1 Tax=uncultured Vagococcus sp. TaxID=189676 RepID=UPI0028D7CDA1|nr:response regulator transcription factor [uncultured Vagococcus sp.]